MYTPPRLARIAGLFYLPPAPCAMVDRPVAADTVVELGVVG